MSSTRDLLIDELEKCVTMGGRYERIRCVNFDRASGNQVHGHFSLVFWAWDRLLGKAVALKFFDPDQTFAAPSYRMRCFEREPELLKALLGKQRCLQLVQSMASHTISVPTADPKTPLDLQFAFFAVEWLEDSIDEYFERQQDFDALTKLKLFHDLLLAVAAIHKYEIFHRDVKPDNFRAYLDNLKRIVVAIDLGTAARFSSAGLEGDYVQPVGHLLYSAPEAFCGLAGHRKVAHFTDYFALGCMLYQLFSPNYFREELNRRTNFDPVCAALSHVLLPAKSLDDRVRLYDRELSKLKRAIIVPDFTSFGAQVPPGIEPILNRVLLGLVAFDYRDRYGSLDDALVTLGIAIRVLKNEKAYQERLSRAKEYRRARAEKLRKREARLAEYLRTKQRVVGRT